MTTLLARGTVPLFERPAQHRPSHAAPELAVWSEGLTKQFEGRPVVEDLALAIPKGVVSGFVGPNGAGKTTTIRMLLGLIRPTSGSGTVLGRRLGDGPGYLPRVGALIEGPTFYPALSGRDNLRVLARLAGLGEAGIPGLLERVGLSERSGDKFRCYSLGMKQRLGIAAALLPRPELLILDEPTNGLDPAGIAQVRRLLAGFAADGMTVVISSHLLAEIEQACGHLVMIREGRLVFQGSVDELVARHKAELRARPESPFDCGRLLNLVVAAGVAAWIDDELPATLHVAAEAITAAGLNRLAGGAGIILSHLSCSRPTLEQIFFELTGRRAGDAAPVDGTAGQAERKDSLC